MDEEIFKNVINTIRIGRKKEYVIRNIIRDSQDSVTAIYCALFSEQKGGIVMKAKIIKTGEIAEVYHESQHGQTTNIYKEAILVNGRMWEENELDFSINSESKEVDLDKELNDFIEEQKAWVKDDMVVEYYNGDSFNHIYDLEPVAKHFFELGLKARINKELVEEVYSHIDSIKDTADRMTSGNCMHNRAAIKFSANTISKVLELIGLKAQKGE